MPVSTPIIRWLILVNTKNGLKSVAAQVFNFDPFPYLYISCTYHVDQCGCESCHVLPCLAMSCGDLSRLICVVSLSYPCRGLNWTSFPTEARRLGSCWACRCNLKPRGHAATASPGTAYHLHHLYHLHLCHSVSVCVRPTPIIRFRALTMQAPT